MAWNKRMKIVWNPCLIHASRGPRGAATNQDSSVWGSLTWQPQPEASVAFLLIEPGSKAQRRKKGIWAGIHRGDRERTMEGQVVFYMTDLGANVNNKSTEYMENEGQCVHPWGGVFYPTWACGPVGCLLVPVHVFWDCLGFCGSRSPSTLHILLDNVLTHLYAL